MAKEDKLKALDAAIAQIERQYGKGSVMKLGDNTANMNVETVPTGSLSLDIALGLGGLPKGRIIEIYGPESSGKTTVHFTVLRKYRRGAVSQDLSMLSMHLIRYMPRISGWILTICTSLSRTAENRRLRLQRLWCAPVQWIL